MARKKRENNIENAMQSGSDIWIDYDHMETDYIRHDDGSLEKVEVGIVPLKLQVVMLSIESNNMRVRSYRRDTGEHYMSNWDLSATTFFEQMQIVAK